MQYEREYPLNGAHLRLTKMKHNCNTHSHHGSLVAMTFLVLVQPCKRARNTGALAENSFMKVFHEANLSNFADLYF